jgi:hypothetical protein
MYVIIAKDLFVLYFCEELAKILSASNLVFFTRALVTFPDISEEQTFRKVHIKENVAYS